MFYAIKLNSNMKTVGYTGNDDPSNGTKTAASHALLKALGMVETKTNVSPSSNFIREERSYPPLDAEPKVYRSHAGNQHAALIATGAVTKDNFTEVSVELDNAIAELSNCKPIDFDASIAKYQAERSKIVAQMEQEGHTIVKPEAHKMYRDYLRSFSFNYCKSQITIIMWDTVKFNDSCLFDEKRNLYVYIIKGKTMYTPELITATELKRVRDSVTSTIRSKTSLTTRTKLVVGQIQKSSTGLLRCVAVQASPDTLIALSRAEKPTMDWNNIDHLDL